MRIDVLLVGCGLVGAAMLATAQTPKQFELYRWVGFAIEAPGAASGIDRWDVEGSCVWTHEASGQPWNSTLWYSGSGDVYVFRLNRMGIRSHRMRSLVAIILWRCHGHRDIQRRLLEPPETP